MIRIALSVLFWRIVIGTLEGLVTLRAFFLPILFFTGGFFLAWKGMTHALKEIDLALGLVTFVISFGLGWLYALFEARVRIIAKKQNEA